MANLFLSLGFLFKSKKIVENNISYVLGDIPKNEIKSIIKFMWKNYAYIFVEYIYLYKFRSNKFSNPQVKISGKNILDNSGLKLISAENLDDAAKKIVKAIK